MRLSVLNQVPIGQDSIPEEALNQAVELAKITEDLGYTRYWVAEHHNTNGLASSSPEILMTRLAGATSSIRIGSGEGKESITAYREKFKPIRLQTISRKQSFY